MAKKLTTKKLMERERNHHGIYSEVGRLTDTYTTEELVRFAIDEMGMESSLRYYLQQQIVSYTIAKESQLRGK